MRLNVPSVDSKPGRLICCAKGSLAVSSKSEMVLKNKFVIIPTSREKEGRLRKKKEGRI